MITINGDQNYNYYKIQRSQSLLMLNFNGYDDNNIKNMLVWIFNTICYIVGTYTVLSVLYCIASSLYLTFSPAFNLLQRYGKDSWAMITGASDGIGEGFCYELARDGFNICLVSRTLEKLKRVEEKIKKINPNIKTKIVVADFKKSTDEGFFDNLMKDIGDIDISLLVNNVGVKNLGFFQEVKAQDFVDEVIINTFPMTIISRKIIPNMMKRSSRSGIINVSSVRGTLPFALMPGYSGTKKFNDLFSRSLSYQVDEKVDVMSLRPSYVTSQMTQRIQGPHVITPQQCARGAMNMLGKQRATSGHWKHRIQAFLITSLPKSLIFFLESKRTKRLVNEQRQKKTN